jgi:hypothetical protein
MAEFDLVVVMDGIADTVRGSTLSVKDRVFEWPTLTVNPPCLVVGYPTDMTFDRTYQRGCDQATFPVWVILGRVDARETRNELGRYLTPAGEIETIKSVLDGDLGGACSSCRVMSATIEATNISGVDYQAIRFDLDVLT